MAAALLLPAMAAALLHVSSTLLPLRRAVPADGAPAVLRAAAPRCCADASASRRAFLEEQRRPTRGAEAFEGTTWSLLLKMAEGGGTMFSVELLDGGGCRFSDSEERGSWQAREAFVVIEKPKGLFDRTLYMSAEFRPATEDDPQDRLVNGMVQRVGGVAKVDGAQASQAEGDATAESLLTIGEFGGIAQLEAAPPPEGTVPDANLGTPRHNLAELCVGRGLDAGGGR